jgi:hypothetical protein
VMPHNDRENKDIFSLAHSGQWTSNYVLNKKTDENTKIKKGTSTICLKVLSNENKGESKADLLRRQVLFYHIMSHYLALSQHLFLMRKCHKAGDAKR